MRLDIFADIICPWCWIGKRRLERALKVRPQQGLTTRWRAFQLNPGMPATGMDRREYLAAKFGNDSQAKRIYDVIRAAGESEGLEFNFDKIQQTPNTLRAHRLVRLAQERGKGSQMIEALFQAYFVLGENIGDRTVLVDIAQPLGFSEDEVHQHIDSAELLLQSLDFKKGHASPFDRAGHQSPHEIPARHDINDQRRQRRKDRSCEVHIVFLHAGR